MIPQGMSQEVTEKMQKASEQFRKCDQDNGGTLDKTEWKKCVRELKCNIPEQDLDGLFDRIDKDKSGRISEREFCEWYSACY
jgi:Ca2+-binding EF-hand superfamily protein